MWNYFDDFRHRVRELPGLGEVTFNEALDILFPQLRIIFVRRRDKVAQAVSLWKAIQTQQWRNEAEPSRGELAAEYHYRALKHLVNELHRWDARWEDWFHATGREPDTRHLRGVRQYPGGDRRPGPRRPGHRPARARRPPGADEAPGRQPLTRLGLAFSPRRRRPPAHRLTPPRRPVPSRGRRYSCRSWPSRESSGPPWAHSGAGQRHRGRALRRRDGKGERRGRRHV